MNPCGVVGPVTWVKNYCLFFVLFLQQCEAECASHGFDEVWWRDVVRWNGGTERALSLAVPVRCGHVCVCMGAHV